MSRGSLRNGFSLVELSIVLVILGLLTGGILAGQSLIRAAELRAVTTEYQRYLAVTQTFRDKYMALPGDMRNATRFWGDDNTTCADAAIPDGSPGTCNGNGNGTMDTASAGGATGEIFQYWKQLALAGLVEGSYTGLAGSGGIVHAVNDNTPSSRLSNAAWQIRNVGATPYTGDASAFALIYGNYYIFGAYTTSASSTKAALKPEEAWNIDTKLDDGQPASGSVIIYPIGSCATPNSGASVNTNFDMRYQLTNPAIACSLDIRNVF